MTERGLRARWPVESKAESLTKTRIGMDEVGHRVNVGHDIRKEREIIFCLRQREVGESST